MTNRVQYFDGRNGPYVVEVPDEQVEQFIADHTGAEVLSDVVDDEPTPLTYTEPSIDAAATAPVPDSTPVYDVPDAVEPPTVVVSDQTEATDTVRRTSYEPPPTA